MSLHHKEHIGDHKDVDAITVNPIHMPFIKESSKVPVMNTNRTSLVFPTKLLGSKNINFKVPHGCMPKQVILALTFDSNASTSALNPMAAYNALSQIQFKIGSTGFLTYTKQLNLYSNLQTLLTNEAVQDLYALGGGPGGVISSPTTYYSVITCPFSRYMLMHRRSGIDTNILGTQLEINIDLEQASHVYSAGAMTSLVDAQMIIEADEYLSSSGIIYPEKLSIDKHFTLPARYWYETTSAPFTPTSQNAENTCIINNTHQGHCIGIMVIAQRTSEYSQGASSFKTYRLRNLQTLVNGQVISRNFEYSDLIASLNDTMGASRRLSAYGKDNYVSYIKLSGIHVSKTGYMHQTGIDLKAKTLQFKFQSDDTNEQILRVVLIMDTIIVYNSQDQHLLIDR